MSDELNTRHAEFINEYFRLNMNGTRAYQSIYGEDLDDNVAAASASQLLRNPKVSEAIDERLRESAMSANEVLARLAEQARGGHDQFVKDNGTVDFKELKQAGKMHLVKSISDTKWGKKVEFYNSQTALNLLGKHLALFVDRVKVETWQDEIIELIRQGAINEDDLKQELGDSLARELFITAKLRK